MSKPSLKSPSKLSQVRIIGGEYRRRLVSFVDAEGLRPTPDRVRETVFNWLGDDVIKAHVLDCCAGSGVLGFEALSRGASQVTLIEPHLAQYSQLQQTKISLNLADSQIRIINDIAESVIPKLNPPTNQPFDLVFLDPPYQLILWQPLLDLLISHHLIAQHTLLYIEADKSHELILPERFSQLNCLKYKKMGQIWAGIYQLKPL